MARTKQTTRTKPIPRSKQQDTGFVQTPLAQSVISSAVIAIMFSCLAYVFSWDKNVVILSFGVSLCVIWFYRLHLFDGLLMQLEVITQQDLNQDGNIGHLVVKNAAKARATSQAQVRQNQSEDKTKALHDFVERCYTIGTSESAMGIKPSDRAVYLENRDVLMRLGLAGWKSSNPRSGWKMLVSEDAALATIQNHVVNSS